MNRYFYALWAWILFLPAAVLAQTATTTTSTVVPSIDSINDAWDVIQLMAKAFGSGLWALGAGLLLALIVAAVRFFKVLDFVKIPDSADKWVAMGVSVLTSISVGLITGQPWFDIVSTAISVGVIAIGGWEALLRPLRDKVIGKAKIGEK